LVIIKHNGFQSRLNQQLDWGHNDDSGNERDLYTLQEQMLQVATWIRQGSKHEFYAFVLDLVVADV
jgi:hypothetical protein